MLAILGSAFAPSANGAPEPPPELLNAVFEIRGERMCATAFLLDDGRVLTSAHVVRGICPSGVCPHFELRYTGALGNRPTESVPLSGLRLTALLETVDVAVFTPGVLPAIASRLHFTEAPPVGTEVYALGFPDCGVLTLSSGAVTHLDPYGFEASAPVRKGNSGSPILDAEWRVVGMIFGTHSAPLAMFRTITGWNVNGDGYAFRGDVLHAALRGGAPSAEALMASARTYYEETALPTTGWARLGTGGMFLGLIAGLEADVATMHVGPRPHAVWASPLWRLSRLEIADDPLALRAEWLYIAQQLEVFGRIPDDLVDGLRAAGRPPEHVRDIEDLIARFQRSGSAGAGVQLLVVFATMALLFAAWSFSLGVVFSRTSGRIGRRLLVSTAVAGAWPVSLVVWWLLRFRTRAHAARAGI